MNGRERHESGCLSCWLAAHAGRVLFAFACLYGVVLCIP
jgi:hypothetical protein